MSNEIATVKAEFDVLDPNSRMAEVVQANVGDGQVLESDLPRVRMPAGGSTQWSYEAADGNTVTTDEITGLLVAVAGRGVLWPSREPSGSRPLVVSHDMKEGYLLGGEEADFGDVEPAVLEKYHLRDNIYDWYAMSNGPDFGFGSAGRGKRVKETQILAVLQKGEVLPVLVHLGGGSLGAFAKFRKGLKVLPHEAIVSLKLERASNLGGQKFSRVKPSLVGSLTPEEGARIKALYTEPLTAMLTRVPGVAVQKDAAPF